MDEKDKLELERLRAENEKLKAKANQPLTLKVSEKGAVSVYGMGRFPTTLYAQQWEKVLDKGADIRQFIKDNARKLATKE